MYPDQFMKQKKHYDPNFARDLKKITPSYEYK